MTNARGIYQQTIINPVLSLFNQAQNLPEIRRDGLRR